MASASPAAPRLDTPDHTPWLSGILAYGPVLVTLFLGIAAWWIATPLALAAARWWSAAILLFLAGVARGLSFFTDGGPRPAQLAVMLLRFLLGLAALATPLPIAFGLLALGYLSILVTDPGAARRGEAPRYFARLRPPQASIAVVGLLLCLVRALL